MTRLPTVTLIVLVILLPACGENAEPEPATRGVTLPAALTTPVRRETGVLTETLVGVPKTFALSYRCDSAGKRALVFSPYPPMATTMVRIEANGKVVARGDVVQKAVEGPFLNSRYQSAEVRQVTGAATSLVSVHVTFGKAGYCEMDDVTVVSRRNDHSTRRFSMNRVPARPTSLSRDGTVALDLPEGWHSAETSASNESLMVGSFPLPRRATSTCVPSAALAQMPADGALIRVAEAVLGDGPYIRRNRFEPRGDGRWFHLGKPVSGRKCGAAFEFSFRQKGRKFIAWVWVHPRGWSSPAEGVEGEPVRGGFSAHVRREATGVLNSLQVESARNEPVRIPFLALDCRNPPNTLGCDRVFVQVSTRIPMRVMSLKIGGRSIRLSPNSPLPGSGSTLVPPRTVWTGYLKDAGLTRPGSPLEVGMPPYQQRWTGTPPVTTTVEVGGASGRGPGRTWSFFRVPLIAGHG